MTTDHYRTLGLLPGAEDAVIRAAYRALMRIYHPDANQSPEAQERSRAIAAAYAVLGNPAARAAYDDEIGLIASDYPEDSYGDPNRAKPLRTAGLASIAVAIASIFLLFSWERPNQGASKSSAVRPDSQTPAKASLLPPDKADPAVDEPPSADLQQEALDSDPMLQPAPAILKAKVAPLPKPPQPPRSVVTAKQTQIASPRPTAPPRAKAASQAGPDQDKLAKVRTIAVGFFDQSWAHATSAKRELLLASRNRSAASRKLCRSDQCAADAYLRQVRETSAIMEGRPLPAQ